MDQRDESTGQPICQSCGAPIRKEENIQNKWIKTGLFVLIAGVAVIAWGSKAVLSVVGGILMVVGAGSVIYGATGTFIDDEEVGPRWIKTGLSVFTAGVATIVLVSELVVALVGGMAIAGGAIAVTYGVTGTFTNGLGNSNVNKCSNCGNTLHGTENITTAFNETLDESPEDSQLGIGTDEADLGATASASETEDSETDYGDSETDDENSTTPDIQADISMPIQETNYVPVYKCKRKNFSVIKHKAIPEGVGCFLSRFDDDIYQDVIRDVTDLKVEPDGILLVEKIDKKVPSSNVNIEMKESIDEWTTKYDKSFITSLEETYKVVIQINLYERDADNLVPLPQLDGPGDENKAHAFTRMDTKLEALDKDGNFVVNFCNSDITTFPADAMVNSTSPNLDLDGVLSSIVAAKGGPELVNDCKERIERDGKLSFCDVYSSRSGNLDFKYIIHVASPIWGRHGTNYEPNSFLIKAIKNVLNEANAKGLREVATPAISAGGWGFPVEVSVLSIFTGVKEYFEGIGKGGMLKYITLVDINPDVTKEVENAMKKIYGTSCVFDEETKQCKNEKSVTCKIIGGTSDVIEKVIAELKNKCDGVFGPVKNYPSTWTPMPPGEPYRLEAIAKNSVDFMQLKDVLVKYIPTAKITRIERVQHPKLYDDMMAHKQKIIKEVGSWSDNYEMKLWHGTRKEAADKIKFDTFRKPADKANSPNGWWYGRGVYFGPTPKVSHIYAKTSAKGPYYMFRTTVMVGRIKTYANHLEAAAESEAKEAPKGYHSIRVHDPSYGVEHVAFHETQACPDYLITYTD